MEIEKTPGNGRRTDVRFDSAVEAMLFSIEMTGTEAGNYGHRPNPLTFIRSLKVVVYEKKIDSILLEKKQYPATVNVPTSLVHRMADALTSNRELSVDTWLSDVQSNRPSELEGQAPYDEDLADARRNMEVALIDFDTEQ